jgi:hypothetical protein
VSDVSPLSSSCHVTNHISGQWINLSSQFIKLLLASSLSPAST